MGKHAIWGYPMFRQNMFLQGTAMVVVARGSHPQIGFISSDFSFFCGFSHLTHHGTAPCCQKFIVGPLFDMCCFLLHVGLPL